MAAAGQYLQRQQNRYLFAYAHMLVDMGLFQEVEINFLPVGHTHCDIDQLFSRFSVHLYGSNCWNFEDLLRKAAKASKMVKYIFRLYGFADFKNHLLSRKLVVAGKKFGGFTKHRKFRFVRQEVLDGNGNVTSWSTLFQMKRSCFHEHWTDLNLNVNGHIRLALKPLTFGNVFEGDLQTLTYQADKLKDGANEKDVLQQIVIGIRSAAARIKDILGDEKGQAIVDSLYNEVDLMRVDHLYPFDWDVSMYRKPPVNWNHAVPFVSQSEEEMLKVREEAVQLVNLEDAGGLINKDMALVNVGDYVIVQPNQSCDSLKRPFWVAQVCENLFAQKKLRVHWLLPPTKQRLRGGKGTKGNNGEDMVTEDVEAQSTATGPVVLEKIYVSPSAPPKERARMPKEENNLCVIRNYPYAQFKPVLEINNAEKSHSNKGAPKPMIGYVKISYRCCIFSFSNLTSEDRLPNNVLDELSKDEDIQWKG